MRAVSVTLQLVDIRSCLQLQSQEMAGAPGTTVKQENYIRLCQQFYSSPGLGCRSGNEVSYIQVKTVCESSRTSYWLQLLISFMMHQYPTHQWWSPCYSPELLCPCHQGTSWCWGYHAAGRSQQAPHSRQRERGCCVSWRAVVGSPSTHHPIACWWYQTLPH